MTIPLVKRLKKVPRVSATAKRPLVPGTVAEEAYAAISPVEANMTRFTVTRSVSEVTEKTSLTLRVAIWLRLCTATKSRVAFYQVRLIEQLPTR
jgi:hypothetical protein